MAAYVPTMPIRSAEAYLDDALLTECEPASALLFIAPDVITYRHVAAKVRKMCEDRDITIFLDNGAAEMGESVSASVLMRAVEILDPDYIIPPDVLSDWPRTRELSDEFLTVYEAEGFEGIVTNIVQFSDKHPEHMDECIEFWNKAQPRQHMWSLPRLYNKYPAGYNRGDIMQRIRRDDFTAVFHYLGISVHPLMDIDECRKCPEIRYLDSGRPIAAACNEVALTRRNVSDVLRAGVPEEYWTRMPTDGEVGVFKYNINFMEGLVTYV